MATLTQYRLTAFLDPALTHWRIRCALALDPQGVQEYASEDGSLHVSEADAPVFLGASSAFRFIEQFRREIGRHGPHLNHVSTPRATVATASAVLAIGGATPKARWHYLYPIVIGSARLLLDRTGQETEMTRGIALLHAAGEPSRVILNLDGGCLGCVLDGVAW